jgi:hypothetical protein
LASLRAELSEIVKAGGYRRGQQIPDLEKFLILKVGDLGNTDAEREALAILLASGAFEGHLSEEAKTTLGAFTQIRSAMVRDTVVRLLKRGIPLLGRPSRSWGFSPTLGLADALQLTKWLTHELQKPPTTQDLEDLGRLMSVYPSEPLVHYLTAYTQGRALPIEKGSSYYFDMRSVILGLNHRRCDPVWRGRGADQR